MIAAPETRISDIKAAAVPRLDSLDAFRGLVILAMTFVNYLSPITGLPDWAHHAKQDVDGFTFVDVVFPGFLFIVGVAIPIALHKRLERGESSFQLIKKILVRAAVLLFFGVITVNKGFFSPEAAGMSRELWFLLTLSSMIFLWLEFPTEKNPEKKKMFLALRIVVGIFLLFWLTLFRSKTGAGHVAWLRTSWWGILGIIGWAYLTGCVFYLLTRGNATALMGVLGGMMAFYIGDHLGSLRWLGVIHNWISVAHVFGGSAADVIIGILVGNYFVSSSASSEFKERAKFIVIFSFALIAAGLLLRPLHGISKNEATTTYTLVTGGMCALLFLIVDAAARGEKLFGFWSRWIAAAILSALLFIWRPKIFEGKEIAWLQMAWGALMLAILLNDVFPPKTWLKIFIPVGQNALFAYLLPWTISTFFTAALGQISPIFRAENFLYVLNKGWPGVLNSAVLTILILALTIGATRRGIILKL